MIVMSKIDYRVLIKLRKIILIISILFLVLIFIPGLGITSFGASRWLNLGIFSFQPSEIAKFGFVIFLAYYMSKNYEKLGSIRGILPALLVTGLICFLIMLQPNMSITMCVALVALSMLFLGGTRKKYFYGLMAAGGVMVPALIFMEPYRIKRMLAFLNPWENPKEEGYQLIQSLYALGNGGLFGVGLFNSRQKYLFLPFSESDFIFSIIGEEFGLLGSLILVGIFFYMFILIMRVSYNANDKFGAFLAFGVGAVIIIQVLINIAVVTGSIPPTGVPLPFMSAGSTSLIVFMAAIGSILNISSKKSLYEMKN